jgi:hypothetical protein
VKAIAVVQEGVAPKGEADDSNEGRNENDGDGNFGGFPSALRPWEAKTKQKEEGPDEGSQSLSKAGLGKLGFQRGSGATRLG